MSEIILHHYPLSPVSEKVRIALGIKRLAWRSVEIPRLPPKPDVMPLTGGLPPHADHADRRGHLLRQPVHPARAAAALSRADLLSRAAPTACRGAISRWTDALFDVAARLSLGANADQLPEAFAKDRVRLFLGPERRSERRCKAGSAAHRRAAARAVRLDRSAAEPAGAASCWATSRDFRTRCAYYLGVVRARPLAGRPGAARRSSPALEAWEQRVKAIGHGRPYRDDLGRSARGRPHRRSRRRPSRAIPAIRRGSSPDSA